MVSKACLTGSYQSKLSAIGRSAGVDLAVMVPPFWDDPAGRIELERQHVDGYELMVEPLRFNGNYHLHHWPTLRQKIAAFRPDLIHMDEEPYNLATWLAWREARRAGAKFLFFSWQNLYRQYPIPFRWMEKQVLKNSDFAIMGNQDAAEVFRKKGYAGPRAVIPQFGTDPTVFTEVKSDKSEVTSQEQTLVNHQSKIVNRIGFAGRLIHGKGVDLLIRALAQLANSDCELHIAGEGPEREALQNLAQKLGIGGRVFFTKRMGSAEMPSFLQRLDLLVLPSRTLPSWQEQFGRILVEAMACGVPVIGSDSGEIPNVIGDAGVIFPEGNVAVLAEQIGRLLADRAKRRALGAIGRQRVLDRYTQEQVAAETAAVYRQLLG